MPIEKPNLTEFYRKFVLRDSRIETIRIEIAGVGHRSEDTSDESDSVPHNVMWRPDLVLEQAGRAGYMVRWLKENSSLAQSPRPWEQSWLDVADQDILEEIRDAKHCLKLLLHCCQLTVEQELLQKLASGEMTAYGVTEPMGHVPDSVKIDPLIWSRSEHTFDFACSKVLVGGGRDMRGGYAFAHPDAQVKFSNISVSAVRNSEKVGPKSLQREIVAAYKDLDKAGAFAGITMEKDHFKLVREEVIRRLGRPLSKPRGLSNGTIRDHIAHRIPEERKQSRKQNRRR